MKKLLLILVFSQPVFAAGGLATRPETKQEYIEIQGPVAPPMLGLIPRLVELAERDGEVKVLLNTFGGYTLVSDAFVATFKELQAKGIKIKCYVGFAAVSAGFHILEHCNERYALQYSKLMFHPVRVVLSGKEPMTAMALHNLVQNLHEVDTRELVTLCELLAKDAPEKCKLIAAAYYFEKLWEAKELAEFESTFIKTVNSVKDAPESFYKIPGSNLPGVN